MAVRRSTRFQTTHQGVATHSLRTTALQDENNRGWANNLQGIHFVFSNNIILSIRKYFAKNNKQINVMLKKLLYFDFEKTKLIA